MRQLKDTCPIDGSAPNTTVAGRHLRKDHKIELKENEEENSVSVSPTLQATILSLFRAAGVRVTHIAQGLVQWSSLAGLFFRPVGKLGHAFPPGLSR